MYTADLWRPRAPLLPASLPESRRPLDPREPCEDELGGRAANPAPAPDDPAEIPGAADVACCCDDDFLGAMSPDDAPFATFAAA